MIIPESWFLYISIAIGILYLALIIIGYVKGFLFELVSLLYTALAAVAAWFVSPILANLYPFIQLSKIYPEYAVLTNFIDLDAVLNTVAYFIIVFLFLKLIYVVLALVLKGMNKIPVLGKINKIMGAIAGLFNATLISIALSMLLTLPVFKNGIDVRNGTVLKYINNVTANALNYIGEHVDLDNIKKQFESFDVDNARQEFKQWIEATF